MLLPKSTIVNLFLTKAMPVFQRKCSLSVENIYRCSGFQYDFHLAKIDIAMLVLSL